MDYIFLLFFSLCSDTSAAESDVSSDSSGTANSAAGFSSKAEAAGVLAGDFAVIDASEPNPTVPVIAETGSAAEAIGNGSEAMAGGQVSAITTVCAGPAASCCDPSATFGDTCDCGFG